MRSRFKSLTCAALVSCGVIGCTNVIESQHTNFLSQHGCSSRMGSYTLAKSHVVLKVEQLIATGEFVLSSSGTIRRPDPNYTYCLDYLASGFANDEVKVGRSKALKSQTAGTPSTEATPFLQVITSNAVDETALIIRKIIRTIFIAVSRDPNFSPLRGDGDAPSEQPKTKDITELEFDPFDPVEMAETNAQLRRYGFCVILGNYTFNRSMITSGKYCSSPVKAARHHPSPIGARVNSAPTILKRKVEGIRYRPRAPYNLAFYSNDDPEGPGKWRLAKLQTVELENISPIVEMKVERSVFAARRTAIVFDDGVLQQVCISKSSELQGALEIPVEIVGSLVALPSSLLQVKINSATNDASVQSAERRVIKLQQELINYELNGGPKPDFAGDVPTKEKLTSEKLNGTETAGRTFNSGLPTTAELVGKTDNADLSKICDALKKGEI